MRYSDIIAIKPLTVRPETAERLFEAPHLFQEMVRSGWVKPCYRTTGARFIELRTWKSARSDYPEEISPASRKRIDQSNDNRQFIAQNEITARGAGLCVFQRFLDEIPKCESLSSPLPSIAY
jgi:hypothetical protein